MGRLGSAALVAIVVAAAACGGDGDGRDAQEGLGPLEAPTFPDDEGGSTDTGSTVESTDDPAGSTTTAVDGGGPVTTTGAAPAESVSFDDPVGDATRGTGISQPPSWTDLAGGELERQGNAYRLTIRLGGTAPETQSGSNTMNIASFYDTDGDGRIDYEIWVNLGPDGWGPVWYDDQDHAAPGEDSNVTVVVDGDELRLLFPDVMLDAPDRLRFSIASEYGPLTSIGTDLARRDDAPDDDRAVSFP
jgi:hypothetical protein